MNINTDSCTRVPLKKQSFYLKPPKKDGLLLQIHHSVTSKGKTQPVRFLQASFNITGRLLAAINHTGDVFIIDFNMTKYWTIGCLNSCSILKFSKNETQLVAGLHNGLLHIIDAENGTIGEGLRGHEFPIVDLSFSCKNMCFTSSNSEAIIWDLNKQSKLQILQLETGTILKLVYFMPVSDNILACFQDDVIHVWQAGTFETVNQILPDTINKMVVKTIAFTLDGRAMLIGGHSPNVIVFVIEIWAVVQTINLPGNILSIKKLQFISHPFDSGCNKVVAILSNNGNVLFYNMEQDVLVCRLQISNEILKYSLCPQGKYIACVMNTGTLEVFAIETQQQKDKKMAKPSGNKPTYATIKKEQSKIYREQMKEVLDMNKLRAILKEYGEYPELYRKTIWTNILQLPNSKQQYDAISNTNFLSAFEDLEKEYPLENKQYLRNLKKTLNSVVSWCPFFGNVSFLPHFIFPFVRFFQNEPVLCFEAIILIIVNYCQYWYEYHPLPPLNILGITENILLEHDSELLSHLSHYNITSKLYTWPLLQTAFAEVLSKSQWLVFWDHVVSNEPSFLLVAVVAYNVMNRNHIISLESVDELTIFYHHQNTMDFRKFIAKTYKLLKSTSDENHPRKYLDFYEPAGSVYPQFKDFPKVAVEYNANLVDLQSEKNLVQHEEIALKEKSRELERLKEIQRDSEEIIRMTELQRIYQNKLNEEHKTVQQQRENLERLRCRLQTEEAEVLYMANQNILDRSSRDHAKAEKTIRSMEKTRKETGDEVKKVEKELLDHYTILLRHKMQIESIMKNDIDIDYSRLKSEYSQLSEEIEKARTAANSTEYLKQLNVATGIAAMNVLINKVESEIVAQSNEIGPSTSSSKVKKQLASETEDLGKEIKKLMELLTKMKES